MDSQHKGLLITLYSLAEKITGMDFQKFKVLTSNYQSTIGCAFRKMSAIRLRGNMPLSNPRHSMLDLENAPIIPLTLAHVQLKNK